MDWDENESMIGHCDQCKTDGLRVKQVADPFEEEVHDKIVIGYWCYACYLQAEEDI